MKTNLFILAVFLTSSVFAQNFWSETSRNQKEFKQERKASPGEKLYAIDLDALTNYLAQAPQRQNFAINSDVVLEIPNLKGNMEKFYVAEASNFSPALQAQFPQIRSYRGVSLDNPAVSISVSVSPRGMQTMRLEAGVPTLFIEPVTTDNSVYKVFPKSNKSTDWSCATPQDLMEDDLTNRFMNEAEDLDADDQIMRDFRLALSCTGEYTQYFGGTVEGALGGMNATMARVNPIFERDLALHLTMIDNNADVVYTNANTDPYSPSSQMGNWNGQLQSTLTSVIGEANYDIGHLFGRSGGGGNAGCIGCVCVDGQKGSGITSPANSTPEGDFFDIDYVAHELGHQLGANHTFSAREGTGVNFEPGSGSTIMGYAGITSPETNVQQNSDDYFHYGSVSQITANVKNKTCPTETAISNNPPTADAGPDYTIPVGTAFFLVGSADDEDGDNLTYTWEQINSSNSPSHTIANPNITTGPLFRSFPPSTSPVRYFPTFDKVLVGNLQSPFEAVSNVARNTNFAFLVRDNSANGGQTKSDEVRVGVTASGGVFKVTAPEANGSGASNQNLNVTWDVAATNESPVNVAQVDILLSIDGGENWTVIASNTANDGAESVMLPANSTSENARIMVKSVGNIFYALSNRFYIDYEVTIDCNDVSASNLPMNIPDGIGNGYGSYAIAQVNTPDYGNVDQVTVNVDIAHTYVGDLQIVLQSPSPAQQVLLWDRQCGTNNNINATFDSNGSAVNCSSITGSILPSAPLSTFNGFQTQGIWKVGVRDGYVGDTGTFNSATITFCSLTLNPLGTSDVKELPANYITVYPNPSNGVFQIKTELDAKGVVLGVYDVSGKLVASHKDMNARGAFEYQLNLSNVAKGVYILQVQNGTKITSKKLIVK